MWQTVNGLAYPLQLLPPDGTVFLMLEQRVGQVLLRRAVQILERPRKKGDITDAFVDAIINCISKGVLHYTNLPEGENPTNKQRRGGGGAAGNP
jgi:hypothetical protein